MRICYIFFGIGILLAGFVNPARGQADRLRRATDRLGQFGGGGGSGGGGKDSLTHRTGLEDSITIHFRYLDSSRLQSFDSSLSDFTRYLPVPWYHIHLGNFGNATRSLLFSPNMQPGWDHGFHAYDLYNFTVAETKFFTTTRPFANMKYMLGSRAEQFIDIFHTQNVKPNWNMAIEYRLINSPGLFQNQNTNHNSYRFNSWYQSRNKRYQNFVIVIGNKLSSGENGGIKTDQNYLDTPGTFDDRANIPTNLGYPQPGSRDPNRVTINTGTFYTTGTFLLRQQYDLGQKDSLVTDSSVIQLFYPRLRIEHTISYSTYHYRFKDIYADSLYYLKNFGLHLPYLTNDTVFLHDKWHDLMNDFSLYTFPDAKNSQQFLKLGATLQNLTGFLDSDRVTQRYYNLFLHGEYRNRTRNQKWDIEAAGRFYVNGLNAGDYNAYLSLRSLISKKIGYFQAGFQNTNRTPSFVFDKLSTFFIDKNNPDVFKKENTSTIFSSIELSRLKMKLSGSYSLITNYTYFFDNYKAAQFPTLFNILQLSGEKIFRFGKKGWNMKAWAVIQQRIGDAPINLPLVSARGQLGYDGNLGFKNLAISFGFEFRYFTPYKAPGYSPINGQYSYQDTNTVSLKAPDISAYIHFRIKTFTAYARAENLNTLDISRGGFVRNNVPTINYPYPGLQIRVGLSWNFVN